MRKSLTSLLLAALAMGTIGIAEAARAAPVATNIILSFDIEGLGAITFSDVGTVSVVGSTVSIAAGELSLAATVIAPVTSTTTVASISASGISNHAATFSLGGVTAQAASEVCGGGPGVACNAGGGIGGLMGLNGFINIAILPTVVALPIDLNGARVGQGGEATFPLAVDAAAFSTGTGSLNTGTNVLTRVGSSAPLTLISPTRIIGGGSFLPTFTSITFTNVSLPVPEPASLLLIGAGVAGLLACGVSRR